MFAEQTTLHTDKLTHLLARKALVFPNQATITANYGHYLILEHAINREQDYLKWLATADR